MDEEDEDTEASEFFRRRLCFLDRRCLSRFDAARCFERLSVFLPCARLSEPTGGCIAPSLRSSPLGTLLIWCALFGSELEPDEVEAAVGGWKADEAVRRLLPIDDEPGVLGRGEPSIE